jgi:hypothetical protein
MRPGLRAALGNMQAPGNPVVQPNTAKPWSMRARMAQASSASIGACRHHDSTDPLS